MRFLDDFGLTPFFPVVVAMEDAPSKPDPAPVLLALERLGRPGTARAVMLGDTPDDIKAARAAGIKGIGVLVGNGSLRGKLEDAGASRILAHASDISGIVSALD